MITVYIYFILLNTYFEFLFCVVFANFVLFANLFYVSENISKHNK